MVNRSGNRPSSEGAAEIINDAVELCRRAGFQRVLVRGDTAFSTTAHFDSWTDDGVRFVFGYMACATLKDRADAIPEAEYEDLVRKAERALADAKTKMRAKKTRAKQTRVKQRVVRERGYHNIKLESEQIAEFEHKPGRAKKSYRMIVLRKNIIEERGQLCLGTNVRYFFYVTNDPDLTAELPALLGHHNPRLARVGATLVRFARPSGELLHALSRLGDSADVDVRRATLESALCLALPGAWESTLYWALHPSDASLRRDALVWAACLGDAAVHTRILELIDDSERRVDAIWALGFCGRIAIVDRCMELLGDEELGPLAAELVCAIAGLSRDEERCWRAPAGDDDDELPNIGEDLEMNLVPAPAASLPIPEPEAIAAWWQERRPHFDPRLRYLDGHPLDHARLVAGLRDGSMRRRAPLAFELAVRSGSTALVNTRAACAIQLAQIDGASRIEPPNYQRGDVGRFGVA